MKAAFSISPGKFEAGAKHLLLEAGHYGLSMLWFTKTPFIVSGLTVYHAAGINLATVVMEILREQEPFLAGLASVTVCYDFKESVLIPAKYNEPAVGKHALALVYGPERGVMVQEDLVTSGKLYNHYRFPADLSNMLTSQFPGATIFHSTSLQAEKLGAVNELLYCTIFHNVLKIMLYKNEKLQLAQQFNYTTPEDVAYQVLNVCLQHEIDPAQVRLSVNGMIDENSRLYTELNNYFLNITLEGVAQDIFEGEALRESPAHFFSHLTLLASCVL